MKDTRFELSKIDLFSSLSEEELAFLRDISNLKRFACGEILFYEGEEALWLDLVVQGTLKIYKVLPNSRELFLHLVQPYDFVSLESNLLSRPYETNGAFIATDAQILRIDFAKFKERLFSNSAFLQQLLTKTSQKVKLFYSILNDEFAKNSEAKVASFLLDDIGLFNTLKNKSIATILNLTPETLSRTISVFKKRKIIEMKGTRVVVLDENALRKIAES